MHTVTSHPNQDIHTDELAAAILHIPPALSIEEFVRDVGSDATPREIDSALTIAIRWAQDDIATLLDHLDRFEERVAQLRQIQAERRARTLTLIEGGRP